MPGPSQGGAGRGVAPYRPLLRKLWAPYTYLVYLPFVGVSTALWGALAVLTSFASKRVAFHCGTVWSRCLCWMNFTRVTVHGRERVAAGQSYVIMANHQSNFDVLAFYGHWLRQFRWVMKEELRKVPGLGKGCEAVGHIFVDRSNPKRAIASLEAARPLLDGGVSVLFFPEGRRSARPGLLPFKKGGFLMALQLGLPILPVTLSGTSRVVLPNSVNVLPGHVRITVHEPIDTAPYAADGDAGRDRLMADVRAAIESGLAPWEREDPPC